MYDFVKKKKSLVIEWYQNDWMYNCSGPYLNCFVKIYHVWQTARAVNEISLVYLHLNCVIGYHSLKWLRKTLHCLTWWMYVLLQCCTFSQTINIYGQNWNKGMDTFKDSEIYHRLVSLSANDNDWPNLLIGYRLPLFCTKLDRVIKLAQKTKANKEIMSWCAKPLKLTPRVTFCADNSSKALWEKGTHFSQAF